MGKSYQMYIQIADMNTGHKFIEKLVDSLVTYHIIVDLVQSYMPEIDLEALTLYYYKYNKWQLFLEEDKEDLLYFSHCFEVDNDSNKIVIQVRYHCEYFLENQTEEMIREDLTSMNEKVQNVQKLYQELREKYMQNALDINVFWASPIWTRDISPRSRKRPQYFQNLKGEQVQLLTNQLKFTPYVNAITSALQKCEKKVHLYLKPFNQDSFTRKSVFTVTYIIAHLEVEEIKEKRKDRESKTINVKHMRSTAENISFKKSQSESEKNIGSKMMGPPQLQKESSFTSENNGDLEDPSSEKAIETVQSIPEKTQKNTNFKLNHAKSTMTDQQLSKERSMKIEDQSFEIVELENQDDEEVDEEEKEEREEVEEKMEIRNQFKKKSEQSKKFNEKNKYYTKKQPKLNYYFLGEQPDGQLCKITPQKLTEMFESNKDMKQIQLLILHTSYPYHHLEVFKKKAKNIILINSNPLYPEPSTVFFIKQFFSLLVKTGNIGQAYKQALAYTISLKHPNVYNELNPVEKDFINKTNQKYVHGTMQCCCCYHRHHPACQSNGNNCSTKYAEYHYKFHTIHCECPRDTLMIHHCDEKKQIMKKHFQVLDKRAEFNSFYFCCCIGLELGYYNDPRKNKKFNQICLADGDRDPHNITFKYKYEKKMIDEEENQLQIYSGKVEGDMGSKMMEAFVFRENNGLIGNVSVTANLLEHFVNNAKKNHPTICNLYGSKRSGRKTIALHFGHLLVIKQLFQRIVIRVISTTDSINGIVKIQMQKSKEQGTPFFIFVFAEKSSKVIVKLSESVFGDISKDKDSVSAIVITEKQVELEGILNLACIKPMPFKTQNCQAYVKMYKHLSRTGKRCLQELFRLSSRGYDKNDKFELYPCSLNQFQILTMLRKITFSDYQTYQPALAKIKKQHAHYYLFVASLVKFTTSCGDNRQEISQKIKKGLQNMDKDSSLFFRDYGAELRGNMKAESENSFSSSVTQQISENGQKYREELVNLQRLKQHYYLIYACTGYKLKNNLCTLLKMFINYSTLIPNHKLNEDVKMKREINYLRVKNSPFSEQAYEATTVNFSSYLSKYFRDELQDIYKKFTIYDEELQDREGLDSLQTFLKWHSKQLQQKRTNSKKLFESYSKQKQKQKRVEMFGSPNQFIRDSNQKASSAYSVESHEVPEESTDVQHIYHLNAVIEAGLQFVRTIIGTHFIYNRLKEDDKVAFLKLSLLLVNNCVILMKNRSFMNIGGKFDLDEDFDDDLRGSNVTGRILQHSNNLVSPELQTMKSEDVEAAFIPVQTNRTYSGRELFNSTRQYPTIEKSVAKSNQSEWQDGRRGPEKPDELLLKELYRLSTYKGVLYLLSELERRCDELGGEKLLHVKIGVQLLGIQVRLEQLHIEKEEWKLPIGEKDRHLSRIAEVFTQKNYNVTVLKKILRDQKDLLELQYEQLGIIKSHIVISLALMSSYYGRYKLVRGNFMIEQIDSFLNDWTSFSLQRRESQQEGVLVDRQLLSKVSKNNPFFAFMRLICENESVYLHIVESFNSVQCWQGRQNNAELQIYMEMLRLFHLFALKNTKQRADFYNKLQFIEFRLNQMKKIKHFYNLSTYVHNFRETFAQAVRKEINKLGEHMILILTADAQSNENDIKMSIGQRLQELISRKVKEGHSHTKYFCVKKKFSLQNLQKMAEGYRCHYLCLYVSTVKNDQTKFCIQNEDSKNMQIQDLAIDMLSKIRYKVGFVCIPKKKTLVQHLIASNPMKRIIYFDFAFDNFKYEEEGFANDLLIFEKMIMIKTVSGIMNEIIERETLKSKTAVHEAFCKVRNSYSFTFVDHLRNLELIRLRNKEFRECLVMHGMETVNCNEEYLEQKIRLNQKERIKSSHLATIQKFIVKLGGKSEEVKIDLPSQKDEFLDVFTFCFKEKHGFNNIFRINLDEMKKLLPVLSRTKSNSGEYFSSIMKLFYERLIEDKILELIFSNRKVIFILEFRDWDKIAQACEKVLEDMMRGFSDEHASRCRHKFMGYIRDDKKSSLQTIIYFFDYQQKQKGVDLQYLFS